MNPGLLRSQFVDLEEPQPEEEVLTIELGRPPDALVEETKTKLQPSEKVRIPVFLGQSERI